MRVILLFTFFAFFTISTFAFDCKELNVGTIAQPKESANDVIRQGVTSKFWVFSSANPIITVQAKAIQYFYMPNKEIKLTQEMINLKYDNQIFANTTYILKDEDKGGYALEVTYNCAGFGGALITYTLTISVPECGAGTFSWKKVCGYPLEPKDGLMVEMSFANFTEIVIRDGIRVNNSFWDPEIQNFALGIPKGVNSAKFKVYMDHNESHTVMTKQSVAAAAAPNASNSSIAAASTDPYKLYPDTKISIPEVDSDGDVVTVSLKGNGTQGGNVNETHTMELEMEFSCVRGGASTVEFILPLDYFRDIVLFFIKDCDGPVTESSSSWLSWLFFIGLVAIVYFTYKNMTQHGKSGLEAVPFYDETSEFIGKMKNKLGSSMLFQAPAGGYTTTRGGNSHDEADRSRNTDGGEEDDTEFKIENISEVKNSSPNGGKAPNKYGSLN
jgi:hypothetical protein